jgi:ABC-type transport system involved in multi-copper enzyme maturation permease subunit
MTSEWSQRTALTTFALVPRRGRVLVAKLGAASLVSVATVLLTALVAVIVAALAGPVTGQPLQWHGFVRHVGGALVGGVGFMALGAGLGALLQHTASALVVYFIAPTLVTVVGTALIDYGVYWIAPTVAIDRLNDLDLSGAVAPTVVALVLWVVLPLTAGSVRWLRREVP